MNSIWSQDEFLKALDFATIAHQGQTYAGSIEGQRIDYINHIGRVAMELIWALDKTQDLDGNLAIQCAILHDTIEDTKVTYSDLVSNFGENVAEGVKALTKNETLPTKWEQMEDSLKRIKQQPVEVSMVKLADRITNLSPPPFHWTMEKRISYLDEARLIHRELCAANVLLAERLLNRINNYEKYIES